MAKKKQKSPEPVKATKGLLSFIALTQQNAERVILEAVRDELDVRGLDPQEYRLDLREGVFKPTPSEEPKPEGD